MAVISTNNCHNEQLRPWALLSDGKWLTPIVSRIVVYYWIRTKRFHNGGQPKSAFDRYITHLASCTVFARLAAGEQSFLHLLLLLWIFLSERQRESYWYGYTFNNIDWTNKKEKGQQLKTTYLFLRWGGIQVVCMSFKLISPCFGCHQDDVAFAQYNRILLQPVSH